MNKQEKLWQSGFGTAYHQRNEFEDRQEFWLDVLGMDVITDAHSVLEPGAGKGENLVAIRALREFNLHIFMNDYQLTGVEVNKVACDEMARKSVITHNAAFLDVPLDNNTYSLVLTRGFLMHVPKVALKPTLAKLYNSSSKYICMAEYFSPVRREVEYHGHGSTLWVDDFGAEMMAMYPDLKLIKYGFKYHVDGGYDLTYFLLSKEK